MTEPDRGPRAAGTPEAGAPADEPDGPAEGAGDDAATPDEHGTAGTVAGGGQPTPDAPPGPAPTSDDLGLASLAAASVGLSVSTVTIWGLRGIGVSLGIIAVVLAGVSYWRAGTSSSGRGMAYGSLALGLVTLGVALWVAGKP